ncbi:MAG TPA: hypothetical protein VN673_16560 [Clostridia bacterium]|nr:hypothetical protein [Clostridia bacterium]
MRSEPSTDRNSEEPPCVPIAFWKQKAASTLYTGDPKVSLSRSGGISAPIIDAVLNQERQRAQDWADQYKWLPVVRVMVIYSF